ncbi:ArsR/SmtB family transcription factor [Telmatospirillum siberiense]|uniref:ArsR/SmtB family transcription factor n=1 Tax=Telmatospirillum siberiense TaxID=382514 RepID=UPI003B8325D0
MIGKFHHDPDSEDSLRAFKHPPIEEVALADALHALSDPVRLDIVSKLAMDGEASCAALDGGRPKSSVSHHFRVLREAGLVRTRNEGVVHMNALRREEFDRRFPGLLNAVLAAVNR